MFAQLEVIAGTDQGRVFPLSPGIPLVIGRGRQTVTRLNDLHVSRAHCQVEFHAAGVVIKDLNSVGGTLVNDHAISEHILHPGDIIQLGETKLRFQCADIADQNTLPPERPGAHIPMAQPIDVSPSPRLDKPVTNIHALPAAIPIPEALSEALPVAEVLPEAIPLPPVPKVLAGERLTELSGSILAHFQVGVVLAKGKSGVVFRAVNSKNRRTVALKVLRPEFARDETDVQRFIRSMKTMMPLRHPNLITLYGAGKKGPYCWIAMEYVEGENLSQVIQRIGVAGMLDWRHGFRIAVHIGRALDFAHSRHIVHRNMTPQNVLIRENDRMAKLGDVMLAKATEGSMAQQITHANEMLGDVRYMSPEQTFGPDQMDNRSDIYSLGALLYATLTGQPPFEAGNLIETITRIRQAPVVMPKKYQMSIPDAFQAVILRMLAKRPEERYQTAGELVRELERIAKYQGVTL
ncbi:MAG TPA: protein kinase [Gemmataceae bacterium]|nr:protein kinase [Gemmataceae bacterium]